MDGYGWIWMDMDGYEWIWMDMDGYGWIWMDIPNSWCFIIVDHVPICFLLKLPYKFKAKPEFNPERDLLN